VLEASPLLSIERFLKSRFIGTIGRTTLVAIGSAEADPSSASPLHPQPLLWYGRESIEGGRRFILKGGGRQLFWRTGNL